MVKMTSPGRGRNQVSTLPEVVRLESLGKLLLHANPGLGLPDEVLGPTIQEVSGPQRRFPKRPLKNL